MIEEWFLLYNNIAFTYIYRIVISYRKIIKLKDTNLKALLIEINEQN